MNKSMLLGITIGAVLIAGLFAIVSLEDASAKPPKVSKERDNTTITGVTTADSGAGLVGAIVLLDNAGVGGKSDVEVTWTAPFTDGQCKLVTVGGAPSASSGTDANGNAILGNDMVFMTALGYKVAHNDVVDTEAILLIDTVDGGGGCALGTDFVTISTVGSEKK